MESNDPANVRGGGIEYVETVRALHQTVVSLRSALEKSRSEVLQLKTRAWPAEDIESALTALTLENHLLRKKILHLNKNDENNPNADLTVDSDTGLTQAVDSNADLTRAVDCNENVRTADELASRLKSVASSLENLTTKSLGKSSQFSVPSRTKSFHSLCDVGDNEPVFTSTPLRHNKLNIHVKEQPLLNIEDSGIGISDTTHKEPTNKATKREQLHNVETRDNFGTGNADYENANTRDAVKLSDFAPRVNKHARKPLDNKFKNTEEHNAQVDENNVEGIISPRSCASKEESAKTQKHVVRFEDQVDSIGRNFEAQTEVIEEKGSQIDLSADNDARTVNKQTNSRASVDKRCDKKISVSVNLEVYRKPDKRSRLEMEPEEKVENENILRHSSSTDLLDQEVDDIELIFTNEDTKETSLKEPLISIEAGKTEPDFDQNASADGELEDDVFNDNFENENQENINFQSQTFDFTRENSQIYDSKSDNSINRDEPKSLKSYYSYQDSSFDNKSLEKDESFDRFEERVRIVETDISKVGIQDVEYSMGRRNTCPNPIQYRPIAHREAIGRGFNTRKTRPILAHSNATRRESGAQTDISALPNRSSWRSESSLAHKVKIGDNFATLPSKYPLPGSRLRLSEKTVEARRILLSDIGFTSMVPELSRSADHLFPPNLKAPSVTNYGQFLKTTDLYSPAYTSQRFMWTTASPSDSHSQSRYSSLYPLPSPPAPSRRCSAPVSPCRRNVLKQVPSKVRFANGSLPELRGDWNTTIDSGDSTDSLVEEAEQYLRRSIDCIVSGKDVGHHCMSKTSHRRASAPEAARDNIPPQGWQPFLPRLPRDLRLDYWVKVISPEGRVRGGRVRFIGNLASHSEQFVGVQLSMPEGHSDGTYNNRRYFQCEPYHGIFVPFKKVIMGWKP